MLVSHYENFDQNEPLWDRVGISACDFRPHFDGDLHNLFTTVHPLSSKVESKQLMLGIARKLAEWIVRHASKFGPQDRFQIIVGWPRDVRPDSRQVIKIGGDIDHIGLLRNAAHLIPLREGWSHGVFPESDGS